MHDFKTVGPPTGLANRGNTLYQNSTVFARRIARQTADELGGKTSTKSLPASTVPVIPCRANRSKDHVLLCCPGGTLVTYEQPSPMSGRPSCGNFCRICCWLAGHDPSASVACFNVERFGNHKCNFPTFDCRFNKSKLFFPTRQVTWNLKWTVENIFLCSNFEVLCQFAREYAVSGRKQASG